MIVRKSWKVQKCGESNYRSESMNNLDWSNVEDEKDKRIRELEDTLRKQKELMEILQVYVVGDPHSQLQPFGLQRKMQLTEDDDQPNSLPESDEIPDL